MNFSDGEAEYIVELWRKLAARREEDTNAWRPEWDEPNAELEKLYAFALNNRAALENWRAVSIAGRKMRDAMRAPDADDHYLPRYYSTLIEFTDQIDSIIDQAGYTPNERDELLERIKSLEGQIHEEKLRKTLEMEASQKLDKALKELSESKRNIFQFNLINIDPATIVALVRDTLEALKHGIDLLNDARFTETLRKRALATWYSGKRLMRAVRRRLASINIKLKQEKVFAEFDGEEPDLGVSHAARTVKGVSFWIRDGDGLREEWRSLGGGVPFRDCWRHNGMPISGPEMVVVPPGRLLMGSPNDDPDRRNSETPQHEVNIPCAFALGRYPITIEQFLTYANIAGVDCSRLPAAKGDFPVVEISWHDAQAYIAWLNEAVGGDYYRLPSEAEWEYCCRAGAATRYFFGDKISKSEANFAGQETTRVGIYPGNAWGLFDMHGNVREWTLDTWHENYADKPGKLMTTGGAWATGSAELHVLRGGGWSNGPSWLRCAYRSWARTDDRDFNFGFRLLRKLSLT